MVLVGQVARIHPKTGSEKQATNADIITIMLLSNMSLRVPLDPLVDKVVSIANLTCTTIGRPSKRRGSLIRRVVR